MFPAMSSSARIYFPYANTWQKMISTRTPSLNQESELIGTEAPGWEEEGVHVQLGDDDQGPPLAGSAAARGRQHAATDNVAATDGLGGVETLGTELVAPQDGEDVERLRRSTRERRTPSRLKDFFFWWKLGEVRRATGYSEYYKSGQ